ncbi:MAG: hypothetical protein ACMZ7B_10610 [Balneola sp.]
MKLKNYILVLFSLALIFEAKAFQTNELEIGAKVPMADQKMEDVTGRSISLNEATQENGLLVIFSCNTCPWVMKWKTGMPIFQELQKLTRLE